MTIIIVLSTIALGAFITTLICSTPITTTLISLAIALTIITIMDMIISKIVTGKVRLVIIEIIKG